MFWSNPSGNSVKGPYTLGSIIVPGFDVTPYNSTSALTRRSPVYAAETTLSYLLIGDSIAAGNAPTGYTATRSKNQMFNVCSGEIFDFADPAIGQSFAAAGSPGSFIGRLNDEILAGGAARVIAASVAIAGSKVVDWAAGGGLNDTLIAAGRLAASVGITFDAAIWLAGPNDTSAGTSQTDYTTRLASVISTLRNNGVAQPIPIFVCVCSKLSGSNNSPIRAAQAAAPDAPNKIFAGIDSDSYAVQGDGTHHTDAAHAAMAPAMRTLMHAVDLRF